MRDIKYEYFKFGSSSTMSLIDNEFHTIDHLSKDSETNKTLQERFI